MTFEQVLGRLKLNEGKIRRYSLSEGVCLARSMDTERIVVIHPTGNRSDWIPEVGDLFADDWEVIGEEDMLRLTVLGTESLKLIKMGWEYRDAVDYVTTFME